MNVFGHSFRLAIFGESHGPGVGVSVDGVPAGLPLQPRDFRSDLKRRMPGLRGTTPRQERDLPRILSGLFQGKTTGAPLLIFFANRDCRSEDYASLKNLPRPSHADFAAYHHFGGHNDPRGGGHFSGRLTVGLVAAGVIAKKIIAPTRIEARVIEVGGSQKIEEAIKSAMEEKDSVGGLVECRASPLPAGLGDPFFDSVESLLSHLIFSIPGIKGIEFGSGFSLARMRGSEANDIILNREGKTLTNHNGGVTGGLTNGNELWLRVAVKPTPSLPRSQPTVDLVTGEKASILVRGRHDTCIALRIPVILEAAVAIVLADLMLRAGKIPLIWAQTAKERGKERTKTARSWLEGREAGNREGKAK